MLGFIVKHEFKTIVAACIRALARAKSPPPQLSPFPRHILRGWRGGELPGGARLAKLGYGLIAFPDARCGNGFRGPPAIGAAAIGGKTNKCPMKSSPVKKRKEPKRIPTKDQTKIPSTTGEKAATQKRNLLSSSPLFIALAVGAAPPERAAALRIGSTSLRPLFAQ